ncbi:MAG: hypothetical protein U9R38_05175, partial [Candidatus Margulisiibacteriota bacterium]|nr:hypothetical protein [Candidatus Margulisiibacteriota bacterium]
MPILGEVAAKVSSIFTKEKKEKSDPFIELPEKELKKYQNWIRLANKKHKKDVEKNALKFIDRLKQKFPDVTDDEIQSKFNYYKVNLARIVPSLTPKEIKLKIKPFDSQDQISLGGGQVFDNRKACKILQSKIDKILKDKAFKYTIKSGIQDLYITNLGVIVVGHSMDIKLNKEVPEDMENLLDKKAEDGTTIPGEEAEKSR